MPAAPRFSVIIPTYNYGRYVSRAIDSALDALGPMREVIVVDDGSTDNTTDVLAGYGERIIAERQPNQGVSAARNRGLDSATGDYVICLDADDRLLPDAFTIFESMIIAHPDAGLVFGGYVSVEEDGRVKPGRIPPQMRSPLENFRDYLRHRFTIGNGRAAIRRELFDRIRYPVGVTHGEDLVVFGQILANTPAVSTTDCVSECFDHGLRARRNFERFLKNGTRTIEALFDPDLLPQTALQLRPEFEARWLMELARAAHKLGHMDEARRLYHRAFRCQWQQVLDLRQMGRYLRSYWPDRKAA
ncbi:glycosyltransferase [bacterium]|nr:glycosyltransferase [bacterium]